MLHRPALGRHAARCRLGGIGNRRAEDGREARDGHDALVQPWGRAANGRARVGHAARARARALFFLLCRGIMGNGVEMDTRGCGWMGMDGDSDSTNVVYRSCGGARSLGLGCRPVVFLHMQCTAERTAILLLRAARQTHACYIHTYYCDIHLHVYTFR